MARRAEDLWEEIRGIRTAPIIPPDYRPQIPAMDEPSQDDGCNDGPPDWQGQSITGRTFVIHYTDAKDQASVRQILCRRLERRNGTGYLHAWCYVRERLRVFRADSISAIIDPETGEVHEPCAAFLGQFAPDTTTATAFRYGLSPQQFADFNAALNVLAFMARADGYWHDAEGERIEDFAASYWLRAEIRAAFDEAEIRRHARRLAPDAETFFVSLDRCRENALLSAVIRRHVAAVIEADGVLDPRELYWGGKIDDYLRE